MVGQRERLGLVVGDVDGGRAGLADQGGDLHPHPLAQVGVQVGQRLVAQDQPGVRDQRAGERDPLLLPAGQLVRVPPREVGEPDPRRASPPPAPGTRPGGRRRRRSANATLSARSGAARARSPGTPWTGRAARAARASARRRPPASRCEIEPLSIRSMPARQRSSVVLPDPDGPSSTRNGPGRDVERHRLQRGHGCRPGRSWSARRSRSAKPRSVPPSRTPRQRPRSHDLSHGRSSDPRQPRASRR